MAAVGQREEKRRLPEDRWHDCSTCLVADLLSFTGTSRDDVDDDDGVALKFGRKAPPVRSPLLPLVSSVAWVFRWGCALNTKPVPRAAVPVENTKWPFGSGDGKKCLAQQRQGYPKQREEYRYRRESLHRLLSPVTSANPYRSRSACPSPAHYCCVWKSSSFNLSVERLVWGKNNTFCYLLSLLSWAVLDGGNGGGTQMVRKLLRDGKKWQWRPSDLRRCTCTPAAIVGFIECPLCCSLNY